LITALKDAKAQEQTKYLDMVRKQEYFHIVETEFNDLNMARDAKLAEVLEGEIAIKVGLLGEKETAFTNAEEAKNAYQTTEGELE
jgi:hypothetical protein